MKSTIKILITSFFILYTSYLTIAQVAINLDNAQPDSSAILDVKSTTKGVLIPRMTTTQRTAIPSPATGLMVYDNTTNSFWYYSGTVWTEIKAGNTIALQDSDSDTKIQVEESADEDSIRIDIAGSERMVIRQSTTGATLINFPNNNFNTFLGQDAGRVTVQPDNYGGRANNFIGYQAGYSNTTGSNNVFNGYRAGFSNTTGFNNVFNGYQAGFSNTSGNRNTFNGYQAGYSNTTGNNNVFNGYEAGFSNTSGDYNVFNGFRTGTFNTTGKRNVFIGYEASYYNTTGSNNTVLGYAAGKSATGSNNVFLGYEAGKTEINSNKLYIENSNSSTPLIYGEFDNDIVKIYGTLGIKNEYTFPIVKGTARQILQTDGTGNTSWTTPNINTDADGDTKIQVEKSADEDNIRIDIAGSERMVIRQSATGATLINLPNNNFNTFLGQDAGFSTTGSNNVFNGFQAGNNNTIGSNNVFNGFQAGKNNTIGNHNIFTGYQAGIGNINGFENIAIGYASLVSNTSGNQNTAIGAIALTYNTGSFNTALGHGALFYNTTGNNNSVIGRHAMHYNITGSNNTVLGYAAGESATGSNNIFLGYEAGKTEINSNRLYIESSNSSTPLIYGEFDNDIVKIHGTLGIKNEYTFPIVKGTAGQVLQTDGTGNTSWATPIPNTDAQALSLSTNTLSLTNGGTVDLSSYANTDAQALSLSTNTLSLTNGGTVDLSSYLDNTDAQALSLSTNTLSLTNGGSVDLSSYVNTDAQALSLSTNTLSLTNGGTVDLSSYLDNTDAQTLSLSTNTLSLTNGGSVDLSSYANSMKDADGNTKIQVEANTNEDKIRFDLNGTERLVLETNTSGMTMLNLPNNNGNVFLGNQAGLNETGANRLYIENSNTSTPLIYGEFDENIVTINGVLNTTSLLQPHAGIHFPNSFTPDSAYIGTAGNFLSFAHDGVSEDFIGYANNSFYFRDSPSGGDTTQPSIYAAAFTQYSSRRWKHNIKDLDNAMSIIQQLQGVTYTWNEDYGGFEDFGFIAEEVHEVLPQVAKKGTDGEVDGVDYGRLTPYLVEAVKGQQSQIQDLKRENTDLKKQVEKINELEHQLKQIQAQLNTSIITKGIDTRK